MKHRTTTALTLLTAILSPIVQAKDDDTSCFKQEGTPFTEYDPKIYAISQKVSCDDGQSKCAVEAEKAHVKAERFLNVSTHNTDEIFDVISEATSLTFRESLSDDNKFPTKCFLSPGDTGYIEIYPQHRCVNGTLGDCVDDLKAGTPVMACSPDTLDDDRLHGLLQCVVVNGTNDPDVEFNPSEGLAPAAAVNIGFLSLLSSLVVVGLLQF